MIFEVDALRKKINKYTSVVYKLMLHNFHLPLKCKITHKIKKFLISQSFKILSITKFYTAKCPKQWRKTCTRYQPVKSLTTKTLFDDPTRWTLLGIIIIMQKANPKTLW